MQGKNENFHKGTKPGRIPVIVAVFIMLCFLLPGLVFVFNPVVAEEFLHSDSPVRTHDSPAEAEVYSLTHDIYPVTVSSTDALLKGARLVVEEVAPSEAMELLSDEQAVPLFAYDIKIMYGGEYNEESGCFEGEIEYQPPADNPVDVTITPDKPLEGAAVEVVHIAQDKATGEVTPQIVANVTSKDNTLEFAADGFSVYVVTLGTYTPRVTFSYDDVSLNVEYCTTRNGAYLLLDGSVAISPGTSLFFKVLGGTFGGVYCDGIQLTADLNGVYAINDITENICITIGTVIPLDITNGSIVIGESSGSNRIYSYYDEEGGTKLTGNHLSSNIYTISGTAGAESTGGNKNITLTGQGDFNIVLSDITIYTGKPSTPDNPKSGLGICAPISTNGVADAGNINITLVGVNTLENVSSNPSDSFAALEKTDNSSILFIHGSSGTLYVTGGADSAGIGSSNNIPLGTRNICINNGTIYAYTKASQGASIGSGDNKSAYNISIYGGDITAEAFNNGAGIGGSGSANFTGTFGEVYIYGGTINASNNGTGASIGGGGSGLTIESEGGDGYVYIYGGEITVDSIGGGHGGISGGDAVVNISGGFITAEGSIGGGNCNLGSGGIADIEISGGTISAANISGGHGYGSSHAGGTLQVTGGSAKVTHVCSYIETTGIGNEIISYNIIVQDSLTAVPNTPVTEITFSPSLNGYGLNDVQTDENGQLYLWIPAGTTVTEVVAGGETYTGSNIIQQAALITPLSSISVGTELTSSLSNGGAVNTRKWQRYTGSEWADITGATGEKYTVQPVDAGKQIIVVINGVHSQPVYISEPSYTVTIPESVSMASNSFTIEGNPINFSTGHEIKVSVRSAKNFNLAMNGAPQNTLLPYSLRTTPGGTPIVSGGTVATFSGNGTATATVYYTIATPLYAGTYTDTLTFTVVFDSGL